MKRCYTCKELQEDSEFSPSKQNKDKLASSCKTCRRGMHREYWKHYGVHQSLKRAHKRKVDGEVIRRWFREDAHWKKVSDVQWRLRRALRTRIYSALQRNSKTGRTLQLLGCSTIELKAHLENQFREGMTWQNYGPVWHVDHRKPCDSFDFSDPAQQRECFHFTNLQPLFAAENLRKAAKIGLTFP